MSSGYQTAPSSTWLDILGDLDLELASSPASPAAPSLCKRLMGCQDHPALGRQERGESHKPGTAALSTRCSPSHQQPGIPP